MTKTLLTAAILTLATIGSPVAKEVLRNEDGDVGVRGAPCAFSAYVDGEWQHAPGRCSMYKNAATNNTLVWIGQGRILIVRDKEERGFAKLYRVVPGTDELGFLGNAVADGNCWLGKTMRFCAK
jgi:hypothetical protein